MELEQTSNNIKNNDDYDDNEHGCDENNDMTKCCPQYTFCIVIK